MRINSNVDAINAQRNLTSLGANLSKSIERLSSGLRINRADDDAAGLTISEKLRSQTRGLNQAVRNAQDGISMLQTVEGGLNETQAILHRMRELAVQAANDTLTDADRGAIASELTSLKNEIDRIAYTTEFNTRKPLAFGMGTQLAGATATDLVVGEVGAASNIVVSKIDVANAKGGPTFTFTPAGATGLTLTGIVNGTVLSQTISLAAMTSSGSSSQTLNFHTLGISIGLVGFHANGTAANIVADLTSPANDTIITGGNLSTANFQVGANANQTVSSDIFPATTEWLGAVIGYDNLGDVVDAFAAAPTSAFAQVLLESVESAHFWLFYNRTRIGAVQNRLEYTIENLATSAVNLATSESRIRDADMAQEMVSFTRGTILQQAGTSMLAQANQQTAGVLSLLRQ